MTFSNHIIYLIMESEIKQKTKHNTLSGQIKTHENR
jgi:hypothetical protein